MEPRLGSYFDAEFGGPRNRRGRALFKNAPMRICPTVVPLNVFIGGPFLVSPESPIGVFADDGLLEARQ